MNKFEIQDKQYQFPYHHIPQEVPSRGGTKINAVHYLEWGEIYMCYMKYIAEKINGSRESNMLDIGCGDAKLFTMIENHIQKTGVDLSYQATLFAKAFNPDAEILCCDVADVKETFDIITAIEVLEHIPDEDTAEFIKQIYLHMKRDGMAYIQVPTINLALDPKHYKHYTLDILKEEIEKSGVPLVIKNVEYLIRHDKLKLYLLYRKVMFNRFAIIRVGFIQRFMWKYMQNKLCISDALQGEHMLVTLTRGQ